MMRWTTAAGMLLALGLGASPGPSVGSGLGVTSDSSPASNLRQADVGIDQAQFQPRLRFFVVGDAPYADAEYAPFERLLSEAAGQQPAFLAHVGDIKGGGQPCTDARNRQVAALFERQPVPMLYTPGDNEWTDCHRKAAGALDPLERLAALRARFFADPEVLHNEALDLRVPNADLPENAYLLKDGVMIVLMHLVGSGNNHRPQDASAMQEWRARSRANRALLDAATKAAKAADVRAMVLLIHANPLFERSSPAPGFAPFFADLDRLLTRYSGPVLLVHGDTHRFQFNQPLIRAGSSAQGAERLWRLEVPGSPFLGGVWVTVTSDPAEPFAISVVYPSAADAFESSASGGHHLLTALEPALLNQSAQKRLRLSAKVLTE
jgi:hypothetical protein